VLDGGEGRNDKLRYSTATAGVTFDFDLDTTTGASTGTDTFAGFGEYRGSAHDDTFLGRTTGWVYADDGDDEIRGPDLVFAGDGDDKIICRTCTSFNGNFYSGAGNDVVRLSGGFNNVYGQEGNDLIVGGTGRDDIDGGEGNDRLLGREGDDNFVAEAGDDVLRGGSGYDGIQLSRATAGVDINLRTGVATGGGIDTDSVGSLEDIWGSGFDDVIVGAVDAHAGHGNDVVRQSPGVDGGDGDDMIFGTGAADSLTGGDGVDTLTGGDGDDYLDGGPLDDTGDGGPGTDTCVSVETALSCELG
jgi:Ca2+-binding RTX toxin-like protein